jgi:hypothetical protein
MSVMGEKVDLCFYNAVQILRCQYMLRLIFQLFEVLNGSSVGNVFDNLCIQTLRRRREG